MDRSSARLSSAILEVIAGHFQDASTEQEKEIVSSIAKKVLKVIDRENLDFSSPYLHDYNKHLIQLCVEMGIARRSGEEVEFLYFDYEE